MLIYCISKFPMSGVNKSISTLSLYSESTDVAKVGDVTSLNYTSCILWWYFSINKPGFKVAPQGLVHGTPAKNVALASANGSEHLHVLQHVAGPVFFNVVVLNRSGFIANVCCLLILFGAGRGELGTGTGGFSPSTATVNWQISPSWKPDV